MSDTVSSRLEHLKNKGRAVELDDGYYASWRQLWSLDEDGHGIEAAVFNEDSCVVHWTKVGEPPTRRMLEVFGYAYLAGRKTGKRIGKKKVQKEIKSTLGIDS